MLHPSRGEDWRQSHPCVEMDAVFSMLMFAVSNYLFCLCGVVINGPRIGIVYSTRHTFFFSLDVFILFQMLYINNEGV